MLGPAEYELRVRGEWPRATFDLPAGVTAAPSRRRVAAPVPYRRPANWPNPILLRELMERGVEVVALQELPRTLEQVYLAAMAQVKHDEKL